MAVSKKVKTKRTTNDGFPDRRDYGPEGRRLITEARERVKSEKKAAVLKGLAAELGNIKGA